MDRGSEVGLNMSNWMRDLKRVYSYVTSPTMAATGGSYMYVEVPGLPNEGAALKRLRIIGTGLTTTASNILDIKVLRDSGKYREAEAAVTGSGEPYVIFAWNDQVAPAGPNTLWLSDVTFSDDIEYADDLNSNMLHLLITAPNGLTSDAWFRIDVWADGLMHLVENTRWPGTSPKQTHVSILRWSTGNVWADLSHLRNPDFKDITIAPLTAATDYLYFGFTEEWTGLWFLLKEANEEAGVTATWEYWNGSMWSTLTIRDNCIAKTLMATWDVVFRYSGVVEWNVPADWATCDLATAVGGTPPIDEAVPITAQAMPTGEPMQGVRWPRYWVRLNLDSITDQATFKWIRRSDDW